MEDCEEIIHNSKSNLFLACVYSIFGSDSELSDDEDSKTTKTNHTDDITDDYKILCKSQKKAAVKSYKKSVFNNHDFCSSCLGEGRLLCCLDCPRAFHFSCVGEGFNEVNVPDDYWRCNECVSKSRDRQKYEGIFSQLLQKMESSIPREFQLPKSLRRQLPNVFPHPETGEYVDFDSIKILAGHKSFTIESRYCWGIYIS